MGHVTCMCQGHLISFSVLVLNHLFLVLLTGGDNSCSGPRFTHMFGFWTLETLLL